VINETISGNVPTSQRQGFIRLLDRLEAGDVLVVTKLDRLGRNVMDVGSTVAKLADMGVRVNCLALGGVDLALSFHQTVVCGNSDASQNERTAVTFRGRFRNSFGAIWPSAGHAGFALRCCDAKFSDVLYPKRPCASVHRSVDAADRSTLAGSYRSTIFGLRLWGPR